MGQTLGQNSDRGRTDHLRHTAAHLTLGEPAARPSIDRIPSRIHIRYPDMARFAAGRLLRGEAGIDQDPAVWAMYPRHRNDFHRSRRRWLSDASIAAGRR